MISIKHIFGYSLLTLLATLFALIFSWCTSYNLGFIFAFPADQTAALLFPALYSICAGGLYIFIFFRQVNTAPSYPFLLGSLIFLISITTIIFILGASLFDLLFTSVIYLATTLFAIYKKRSQTKATEIMNDQSHHYFSISIFKLCILYLITFGLFRYYWWYKNWQHIKTRDNSKKCSPVLRSIFAVFFYENFLDDVNKTNRANKVHDIPFTSLLPSVYIFLIIGSLLIGALSFAYSQMGLPLEDLLFSSTKIFSYGLFILAAFLYILPQIAINRLNIQNKKSLPQEKNLFAIEVYLLISIMLWLPIIANLISTQRTDARNAFILYDYHHYQAAYKKIAPHVYDGKNNAEEKFLLAQMYFNGLGVPEDKEQAFSWLEDAATQGHAEAQYQVATLYIHGNVKNDKPNYQKAIMWYEKAVAQGHVYAANNLGTLYSSGKGVQKNKMKALELYQFAANKGDEYAMYNVGSYYKDDITPPDYLHAVEWFKKSIATKANICAYNDLGMLYAAGKGVTQDKAEAEKLLKKAGLALATKLNLETSINNNALENDKSNNPLPLFVAYQYRKATHNDATADLENEYSATAITNAKHMLKKIAADCWS